MDLLVCEAPLDNSFQKDKLELVNKGSLGRRRKPSRANLKQLLSPGDHFSLQTYSIECPSEDASSANHVVEKKCVTNHLNGDIEGESISTNRATDSISVAERTFSRNGFSETFTDYVNIETKVVESTVVEKTLTTKQNGEKKIQSKYSAEREALALHIAQKASSINLALGKCSTQNHIPGKNLVTIKTNNKFQKTNHITENSSVTNHVLEKSSSAKPGTERTFEAQTTKQKLFSTNHFQEKTVYSAKQPEKLNSIPSSKTFVPNGVCGKVCLAPQKYEISRTPTPIERSTICVKPNVNGQILKEREKSKPQTNLAELQRSDRKSPPQGSEGRSAVLIQTWERRSRSDSLPKRTRRNKENTMPPTGAARVRDSCSDEAILYRITENGTRYIKPSQMKGKEVNMNGPEPEWISLSRKLCAKYVEGNAEPLSQEEQEQTPSATQPQKPHHPQPQHNTYENQVRVPEPQIQQQLPHQPNPPNRSYHQHLKEEKKIPEADVPTSPDEEPPWIHLSRKLCTKFIEEHIEFPVVVKEESKKEAVLGEPNGDVRIIEKIGQAKGSKSKVKKESEPEWVSLSRKLRAKFIESHIDDPDTISLENQLNASDPEETSSDSLPDASTENIRQKSNHESQNKSYFKGQETKHTKPSAYSTPYQNRLQQNSQNTLQFPEEECSWEYQEMEFDQESDTFQESESNEETPWESSPKTEPTEGKSDMFSIDSLEAQSCSNVRPAYSANPQFISNVECYNNDVSFAPFTVVSEKPYEAKSGCEKKEITVQFISHNGCKKAQKENKSVPKRVDRKTVEKSDNSSFFNLTTWEDAHFESDSEHKLSPRKPKKCDDLRSKSMENVCDPFQSDSGILSKSVKEKMVNGFSVSKSSKSEEYLDKVDEKKVLPDKNKSNELQNSSPNLTKNSSSNGNCSDVSTQSVEQDETSMQYKEKKSECSKTSQTDLHLLCNGFNGSLSNGHFDPDSNVFNGLENLKPKTVPSQCCKTSQTDLNLICCEHLSSDDSVSLLNGDAVKRGNKFKNGKDRDISEKRVRKSSSSSSDSNSEGNKSFKSNGGNKNNQSKSNNIVLEEECRKNGDVSYHESQIHSSIKDHFQSDKETNGNSNQPSKTEHFNREQNLNQINNGLSGMKKHFKCNGAIPNGSNSKSSKKEISPKKEFKVTQVTQSKKSSKTESKTNNSKQSSPVTNEYANIQSSMVKEVTNSERGIGNGLKHNSIYQEVSGKSRDLKSNSQSTVNLHKQGNSELQKSEDYRIGNGVNKGASLVKIKSKSLHDLSRELRGNQSSDDDSSLPKENGSKLSPVKFQEFEFPSDIPLCAKLVSKQQTGKKTSTSSISSSYKRDASPGSETSHVYEDMFKETTSCPSDSEASSWTVMKNNSYYVNGRSSSMNDLDCSDSCSMSVKYDCASSGSEQSTLRSRRSSCASSSFYVNLRDYDQHMLEPGLAKKKKNQKEAVNAKINSNPPTPESLRHLFTSPLSSMHSPANRLINRIPNEAESHYYSTATAASSAFKHGFDPVPPKPKKTERSSSIKIKDIAHGIILTFRRFQNHSKSSHVSPTHYVDVSHLAESGKSNKAKKEGSKKKEDKGRWAFPSENGRMDSDSGCPPSDTHNNSKPKRSSSDLSPRKFNGENSIGDGSASEKKKGKSGKKSSNNRDKGKKGRSKSSEPRTVPTVTRKVQQMEDGTLYLVTTVSGDTALPGVYSDSPDTSSELSTHPPVKMTGESNC